MRSRDARVLLVALAATLPSAGVCAQAQTSPATSALHDSFWDHQPAELREQLIEFYGSRSYSDPLIDAERRLILARVRREQGAVCEARTAFETAREDDPARRLWSAETAAFLAAECGAPVGPAFRRAAEAARSGGDPFKAEAYDRIGRGRFRPKIRAQRIKRRLEVPRDPSGFVLGGSAIRVPSGAHVAMQAERTVRDWLSYQLDDDQASRPPALQRILTWHEGARVRDLVTLAGVVPLPVRGTLVVRDGERWLAPDETGRFRFEILPDKIAYPTTRVFGAVALLVDTHGVAAIEREAALSGVPLAIACGDHPSKMEAAYRLARLGVSVWFPCDRFVADVLGHDARGVLLGSAPVRPSPDGGAIIGDRPVTFSVDETIVVEDGEGSGAREYDDAPARYFRELARHVPLRLEIVVSEGDGGSRSVVERARTIGAAAIAVRVVTEEDAAPVRRWLAESARHRAVLFHSAPYPDGYALFDEFPEQTTFGDPRPRFLSR